jgi:hypothetical protein
LELQRLDLQHLELQQHEVLHPIRDVVAIFIVLKNYSNGIWKSNLHLQQMLIFNTHIHIYTLLFYLFIIVVVVVVV